VAFARVPHALGPKGRCHSFGLRQHFHGHEDSSQRLSPPPVPTFLSTDLSVMGACFFTLQHVDSWLGSWDLPAVGAVSI